MIVVCGFVTATVAVITVVYSLARLLHWSLSKKYSLGKWGGK
jgi:hypothetical protein